MITENLSNNIPCTSVTDAITCLSTLYIAAIKARIPFKQIATPFFWGAPGVGKSEGVYQLAENIGRGTGKRVDVKDVRLLLFSPIDMHGLPVVDEKREFAKWVKPYIFDMDSSDDVINVLFLDELSAAPVSVQGTALQLCLDRKIGTHKLPDNCIVIAAGNRTTDKSISYTMPKALCNRLMHFNIEADFSSWRAWALRNGIDERIIGYLSFDNSRFARQAETSDLAFPTPRSWSFVSDILKSTGSEPDSIHTLIAACVGSDVAIEFGAWCSSRKHLPDIEHILSGTCRTYPSRQDTLFALVASLSSAIVKKKDYITTVELDNVCSYANHFPSDFAMALYKDLCGFEELKLKLFKCPSMKDWLRTNRNFL